MVKEPCRVYAWREICFLRAVGDFFRWVGDVLGVECDTACGGWGKTSCFRLYILGS